jgi:hypothetical protein
MANAYLVEIAHRNRISAACIWEISASNALGGRSAKVAYASTASGLVIEGAEAVRRVA